jgi:hypothetical protein
MASHNALSRVILTYAGGAVWDTFDFVTSEISAYAVQPYKRQYIPITRENLLLSRDTAVERGSLPPLRPPRPINFVRLGLSDEWERRPYAIHLQQAD